MLPRLRPNPWRFRWAAQQFALTMMQTRLVLIRHGQVDADWRGRIYGSHDVALSPRGRQQAQEAAKHLHGVHLDAVICSPLSRARFGATAILEGRKLQGHQDPDLREIDRGEWIGARLDQLAQSGKLSHSQWMRNPAQERPPGGENLTDLADRVLPRLDYWAREFSGKVIAIVAHSWVIRIALCEAMNLGWNQSTCIQVDTGALSVIDWGVAPESEARPRESCLVGLGLRSLPDQRPWFRRPR